MVPRGSWNHCPPTPPPSATDPVVGDCKEASHAEVTKCISVNEERGEGVSAEMIGEH